MNWGVSGVLVLFGAFVVLLIFNPNLSCFGKRLKSPFYPLLRRKQLERERARQGRPVPTEDYGFHLSDRDVPKPALRNDPVQKKTDDYGFKLD
jgi:hypothetical protein